MPETLALDSQEIEKKFGYSFAVRKVTLRVRRGEFVVLFGSNGAGKTTFLKMALFSACIFRSEENSCRCSN